MIKHIVMWNLKEEAMDSSKEANAKKMKTMIEGLKNEIAEIIEVEVGINYNDSDAAFDVCLYSVFKTKEDLDVYQNHPKHIEVVNFIKEVIEERVVVDYIN